MSGADQNEASRQESTRIAADVERPRRRPVMGGVKVFAVLVVVYLLIAYAAMPAWWIWRTRSLHPALQQAPTIACTRDGIPGDPLNMAIIASETELTKAMLAAKWNPADPITLESAVRIAEGVVLHRPYPDAPVSNLYVWGRKEDKAFEQPVGHDPRHRHHVRFWRSETVDKDGRPVWIGSATYDLSVELSRTTGQITHHISADVDGERDKLVQDLRGTALFDSVEYLNDFQPRPDGRNGGGDPWHTDRRLAVVVLRIEGSVP